MIETVLFDLDGVFWLPEEFLDRTLPLCVAAMRERIDADHAIVCNGAGNFSGWWHRYWRYGAQPSQLFAPLQSPPPQARRRQPGSTIAPRSVS